MDGHEAGVESPFFGEEGGQSTEVAVHETLQPTLRHLRQLGHADGQVVECLKERNGQTWEKENDDLLTFAGYSP